MARRVRRIPDPAQRSRVTPLAVLGGAVLLLFMSPVIMAMLRKPEAPTPTRVSLPVSTEPVWSDICTEAYMAAQEITKGKLKAPATAKFPWYDPSMTQSLGNGVYVVTVQVDAENSFGALLRQTFIYKLQARRNMPGPFAEDWAVIDWSVVGP